MNRSVPRPPVPRSLWVRLPVIFAVTLVSIVVIVAPGVLAAWGLLRLDGTQGALASLIGMLIVAFWAGLVMGWLNRVVGRIACWMHRVQPEDPDPRK